MVIRSDRPADHVLRISIDRPERRNALDAMHFQDLASAWRCFRDDNDAWVAIVTGVAGSFCSGADLKDYVPEVAGERSDRVSQVGGISRSVSMEAVLRDLVIDKPIIAAIDGPCMAGGMEMLTATDIRIATPNAIFGVTEPKSGFMSGGGATARLPRQIPYVHAMEMLMTADPIDASRALEIGLINEVCDQPDLEKRSLGYAHAIVANAPAAIRAIKRSVTEGLSVAALDEALQIEREHARSVLSTQDAAEGTKAYNEKRRPKWIGR